MLRYSFQELLDSGCLRQRRTAVSVGVFDGVHKGHQALLRRLVREKEERGLDASVVVTFSSNPKGADEESIDTLRMREEIVGEMGVDVFAVIDFSPDFSKLSGDAFLKMLLSISRMEVMVEGEDFRFGNPLSSLSASDAVARLEEMKAGCTCIIEKAILTEGGEKISSTLVRRVIDNGGAESIPELTGRNYRIDLTDIPFRKESKTLVFRALSVPQLLPSAGVYRASLVVDDGREVEGTAERNGQCLFFTPLPLLSTPPLGNGGAKIKSIYFGERK